MKTIVDDRGVVSSPSGSEVVVDQPTTFNKNVIFLSGTNYVGVPTFVSGATITGSLEILGNTLVRGTLTVVSGTVLSSSLFVSGTTTLSGAVTLNGNETVRGNLFVSGTSVLSGTVTNLDNLLVSGSETVSGSVSVLGTFAVSGSSTLSGSTTVLTNFNVSGSANILNDLTLVGDLVVSGTGDFLQTLTAQGTSILSGGVTMVSEGEDDNFGFSPYELNTRIITSDDAITHRFAGVIELSGTSGIITASMPLASVAPGSMYVIRITSADTHVLTGSSEVPGTRVFCTLTGSSGSKLTFPAIINSSVALICDGANYLVVGGSGSLTLSDN